MRVYGQVVTIDMILAPAPAAAPAPASMSKGMQSCRMARVITCTANSENAQEINDRSHADLLVGAA